MGLFSRKETPQAPVYRAWADEPVLRGRTTNMRADGYDPAVVFITLGLLAMGALMVYSASISLADSPRYNTTQYHFLLRHLSSIALGIVAAYAVCRIPMRVWYKLAPWLMAAAVLFLVAVLVPGVGKSVNGSRRWINLGLMNLQVTEFAKFAILLGAAAFTVRRQDYMHSFSKGLGPMALVMCMVAGLISLQPDLGAIMVTVAIAMGVLFLGGLNLRIFVVVSIAVVAVVTLMIYDSPWRLQRVMAYLDPWSSDYALNKAYQLSHSLIAFGRGELLGVGLGASVEKLHYLPEAHTDFILAGLGMAIMVLFPKLLVVLAHLSGIETPMYALFVVCIGFMLCILMALTSIVSKQNQKITTLIQMVGIYEKRMREVEENINKEKMEDER